MRAYSGDGMDPQRRERDPEYLAPYREAVLRHGAGFEATLWQSREHQRERFRVICGMADVTGRVVVDAGCGRGDMAAFLRDEGLAYGRYIGLEAMPEMVGAGRAMGLEEAHFFEADFASDPGAYERCCAEAAGDRDAPGAQPDLIVFSGSLNTFEQGAALEALDAAWGAAREAIVFNFLSDRCAPEVRGRDTSPARRFDALAMVAWALERTTRVRFRQDYFDGHDATIGMMKRGG